MSKIKFNQTKPPFRPSTRLFFSNFALRIRRTGIMKGSLHSLRHSFASHLAMQGVDMNKIREMMGHSSIVTTQIYAHLLPSSLPEAVAKFPSINIDDTVDGHSANGTDSGQPHDPPTPTA